MSEEESIAPKRPTGSLEVDTETAKATAVGAPEQLVSEAAPAAPGGTIMDAASVAATTLAPGDSPMAIAAPTTIHDGHASPVAAPVTDRIARVAPRPRDLSTRIAEMVIYLLAVVGAVAIGLGMSDYLGLHRYVYAYLIAYAAFRFADLLVRDESMLGTDAAHFARRVMNELPVLALFAAAPLERSYYTGDAPNWLAGLGILIELIGLWLVLGSRIQLGFYSPGEVHDFSRSSSCGGALPVDEADGSRTIVRCGFYGFIRHPIYLGEFMVLLAWPFEYAAPITAVIFVIWGAIALKRRIKEEETEMLADYGDEYDGYMRTTDAILPNVW
jgi:steroid 5-alpha reductase family enzyme